VVKYVVEQHLGMTKPYSSAPGFSVDQTPRMVKYRGR